MPGSRFVAFIISNQCGQVLVLFSVILALLTLPIYLLAPLAALAGRVFESLAPGLLPPWLAFIATETFQVIAGLMLVWYLIVTMLGIGKLMEQPRGGMNSCCLELVFVALIPPFHFLLLVGMLVAFAVFKRLI
jgi:hypothetical protein